MKLIEQHIFILLQVMGPFFFDLFFLYTMFLPTYTHYYKTPEGYRLIGVEKKWHIWIFFHLRVLKNIESAPSSIIGTDSREKTDTNTIGTSFFKITSNYNIL